MKVTRNQLRAELKAIATGHDQINSFFWGGLDRAMHEETENVSQNATGTINAEGELIYPLMCCYVAANGGNFNKILTGTPLVILIIDKVFKDYSSLDDTESDTQQVCHDVYSIMDKSKRWRQLITIRQCTTPQFFEKDADEVYGHGMQIQGDLKDERCITNLPLTGYEFDQNIPPDCVPATVQNSELTELGQVSAGGFFTVSDSNVSNSDDSYIVPLPAESPLELPDTPIVVKNSLDDVIDSSSFPSVSGGGIIIGDVITTLNTVPLLDIPAETTQDIILQDQNMVPIIPDSIVGNVVTVTIPEQTDAWIRNSDWLDLPSVSLGDDVVYGLYAIYEGTSNELIISLSGTGHTINWGDATIQVTVNLVHYTKTYVYASVPGPVSIDRYGRNYKQVIVKLDLNGICTQMYLDRNSSEIEYNLGWLDIVGDTPTTTILGISSFRRSTELERLWFLDSSLITYGANYNGMPNLRVFDVINGAVASMSQTFFGVGDFRDNNNNPVNFNFPLITSFINIFNNAQITKLGNLDFISVTSFIVGVSESCSLYEIGNVNIPSVNSLASGFPNLPSLRKIGLITTGLGLTDISNMLTGAFNVNSVVLTECANVTVTTNALANCMNLTEVILTNLTVGIDINNSRLQATELNAFMTSLGTASGSQTIDISGNPGSLSCDVSIATIKGFTVITA